MMPVLDFDKISFMLFLIITAILLLVNRKKVSIQKVAFPALYILLIRTRIGLRFMERTAEKYREVIKLIGLCFIGLAFAGMLVMVVNFMVMMVMLIRKPLETAQGVSLLLPLTNIPGIGYLSFWHFLIGIFIIVVLHEFAHGIMARVHGVKVKSSGIGFLSIFVPIIPLAFVEPDEKKLSREKDHIQYSVFAAGPCINIIVAFLLVLLLPYVANPLAYAPFEEKITQPLGVSFSSIQEGFPTEKSGLKEGMVISKVDGNKVANHLDFLSFMYTTRPGQNIVLETSNGSYPVITTKNPDNQTSWGYIGVKGIVNERDFKAEYKNIGPTYTWFRGLFKWLYVLNLLIGLMNLLPLYITDGGRMFGIALFNTIKDKKKAAKIFNLVGMIFLAIILISLALNYGSKLIGIVNNI